MILNENNVVYCDANFLIAYFVKNPQEPDLQKQAKVLFAQMLVAKCKIMISPLAFDECWNGIRKAVGPKKITQHIRFAIDNLLKRTPFKLRNGGATQYSYSEIINDLADFTENILNHKNFEIVQLIDSKKGVINALDKLNVLKPRDAFHLIMALDNGSSHMVTNDGKLKTEAEKSGITCLGLDKS